MKVKVLKNTANELKIEVEGEGHSLLNLLQKTLLEDDSIEMAGYHVPHPLFDRGILYVHTKEQQNPRDVVKEAAKMGFESIIMPKKNAMKIKSQNQNIKIIGIETITEALKEIRAK